MWYVELTNPQTGKIERFEGLTREQAADIHKREYLNGANNITSGKMNSTKE